MLELEKLHPADVLRIALKQCQDNRKVCKEIPDYSAIALEWERAIGYIELAINEIDY